MDNFSNFRSIAAFDVSVEAFAAALIENHPKIKNIEQVMIRPQGHSNRQKGTEVISVEGSVFDKDGKELLYVDVNREGLFDSLPDMLFFKEKQFEDDVEKAKYLAEQQESARLFFLPFEEVLYQSRTKVEQNERKILVGVGGYLSKLYDLDFDISDAEQSLVPLALLTPFLPEIAGDPRLTEHVLKFILKKNISLVFGKVESIAIPETKQGLMGESLLGMGLVCGSTFMDCIPTVQIEIPLHPQEVETWLQGSKNRKFLEELIVPSFFPAGQKVETVLNVIEIPHRTQISLDKDNFCNMLGFTTLI